MFKRDYFVKFETGPITRSVILRCRPSKIGDILSEKYGDVFIDNIVKL